MEEKMREQNISMVQSDDDDISRPIGALDLSMDEKIDLTKDSSINAEDVLCGRGKISFNHGKFRAHFSGTVDCRYDV
jgi:hypothetical protein